MTDLKKLVEQAQGKSANEFWLATGRRPTDVIVELATALAAMELPPYGYLRENNGHIQISIGPDRPANRSGGYATPWAAIYTAPPIEPTEDMVIAGFECDAMQALCSAANKEKGWPYSCREAAELVTEIYKAMVENRAVARGTEGQEVRG